MRCDHLVVFALSAALFMTGAIAAVTVTAGAPARGERHRDTWSLPA